VALPPQANVFAYWNADPAAVEAVAGRVQAAGTYRHWRRVAGWVLAEDPLPGGAEPPGDAAPEVAIFEGAETAAAGAGPAWRRDLGVAALTRPASLSRLADTGFVAVSEDGRALAVRPGGGLAPLYVRCGGGSVTISTRLGDIPRLTVEASSLDLLVHAVWYAGLPLFPDNRSFLTDVAVVPFGHHAVLGPDHPPRLARHWDPRPAVLAPSTAERLADHATRLRELLLAYLERHLAEGANLLTLSGGVDSSALAILAAGVLGRGVSAFSLVPPSEPARLREIGFLDLVEQRSHLVRCHRVDYTPEWALSHLGGMPDVGFPILHPALRALPEIMAEEAVAVLFGGESADEMVGSLNFTMPDWITHTRLPGLRHRSLPSGPRDVLRWWKWRLRSLAGAPRMAASAELPPEVSAPVRDEYQEWWHRRRRALAGDRRPRAFTAAVLELDGWLAMNWEATTALGVRRAAPFAGREVIELALSCHPGELIGPGTKRLLRAGLAEDLPGPILRRQDKGGWPSAAETTWARELPGALGAAFRPGWPTAGAALRWTQAVALTQLSQSAAALGALPRSRAGS